MKGGNLKEISKNGIYKMTVQIRCSGMITLLNFWILKEENYTL